VNEIISGSTDQQVYFRGIPGTTGWAVRRSRNGAASVAMTTPTVTEIANMDGVFALLVDEDTTIDNGHQRETMVLKPSATGHPDVDPIIVDLVAPAPFRRSVAFNNFSFVMVSSTDGVTPTAGLTVTAERSIDGGAFAACANSVTGISAGAYRINLATTDLAGKIIVLKFTATGAIPRLITIVTSAP
jgi:hypothetical protein